jgi:hypothetical protein
LLDDAAPLDFLLSPLPDPEWLLELLDFLLSLLLDPALCLLDDAAPLDCLLSPLLEPELLLLDFLLSPLLDPEWLLPELLDFSLSPLLELLDFLPSLLLDDAAPDFLLPEWLGLLLSLMESGDLSSKGASGGSIRGSDSAAATFALEGAGEAGDGPGLLLRPHSGGGPLSPTASSDVDAGLGVEAGAGGISV